jgi:hypothetical protein
MLAIIVIYVIAMFFAVRKDRSENPGVEKSVVIGQVNPRSEASSTEQGITFFPFLFFPAFPSFILSLTTQEVEQGTKNDRKEASCCECCSCCDDSLGDRGSKKDKKDKKEKRRKEGSECCVCLKFLLCKQPLTRADKITIALSMVWVRGEREIREKSSHSL